MSKIGEFLTAVSLAALLFSYVNVYTFFDVGFDIDISTYFQATELIYMSVGMFALIIISLAVFGGWYFLNEPAHERKRKMSVTDAIGFGVIVAMNVGLWIYVKFSVVPFQSAWLAIIGFSIMGLLMNYIIFVRYIERITETVPRYSAFFIFVVIFVCLFIDSRNTFLYKRILHDGVGRHVKLMTSSDERFETNDSIVFVGSNSSYYFFVKRKDRKLVETIIIPASEIKRVLVPVAPHVDSTNLKRNPRTKRKDEGNR